MAAMSVGVRAPLQTTMQAVAGPYIGPRPALSWPTRQTVAGLPLLHNPIYSIVDRFHGVRWGTVAKTPVFGPGGVVTPDDVHQGHCGDCYLDAAMAAFALQKPAYIQQMVQPIDARYVKITLPGSKPFALTTELPLRPDGVPQYCSHDKGVPLWPALLEKGFAAKSLFGYDRLGLGGQVYTGMAMLTGRRPQAIDAPQSLSQDIAARFAAGQPLVMATQMSENALMKVLNIYSAHVYTVIGTAPGLMPGETEVLVQECNPWGVSQPTKSLNESELRECFSGLSSDTQYYDF